MKDADSLVAELQQGRQRFLALVADIRPELHRYCARMVGSVIDGEDIVQETLARAYYALSEFESMPPLRPWLFRIAHGRAIDYLRRYERKMGQPLDAIEETTASEALDAADMLAREEALRAAAPRFLELPPAQRSTVILKDVMGHSLEEIAGLLELSVPAVKAALHRGRERLRLPSASQPPPRAVSPAVARYAALFNARDWDGVRAMLIDDVKLDLVSRLQRTGRADTSSYFGNYDSVTDWSLVPAWVDGREMLAVFRDPGDPRPGYFIELTLVDERIAAIRDFRYVPHIARDASVELARTMT